MHINAKIQPIRLVFPRLPRYNYRRQHLQNIPVYRITNRCDKVRTREWLRRNCIPKSF
ncbi:hypothetical protein HanHA300_Chr05g0172151 [Helianthus annuus]|nr:hypothetical protein HanHA300_Chr05g0172151 [Helianthus annuus]KAJ0584253.1 hypothetical protein HanHA89_Chr05g0186401 [Helianthus annuus]